MSRRPFLLLAVALAGCASLPLPPPPGRDTLQDFHLEGRFALKAQPAGQPPQSAAGRLTWTHKERSDRVLLANPLGHALAEIEIAPGGSRLRTGDGKTVASDDPDTLIETATGHRLPVARLADWLLGRGNGDAGIERDALNRPARLRENGWLIAYAYDDERPDAPPARLTITRDGELELKIRIETWKNQP